MTVRIDCARLLTAQEQAPYLAHAAILAEDGRICWVGPQADCPLSRERAGEWVDFSEQTVIPGLVNAHGHSSLNCMRAASDAGDFTCWARELSPYTSGLTHEAMSFGCELSVMEMLSGGTTCVCDCTRYGVGLLSRAAQSFGMRSIAGGLANSPELRRDGTGNWDEILEGNRQTLEQFQGSPLASVYVGAHSPYNCTPQLLRQAKAEADRLNTLFVIHAAETRAEERTILERHHMRPIGWLDALGVLDRRTVLIHCVHLNDQELALIARRGCGVIHCPVSNAKLGSGVARVRDMLRGGISVGLGTDSMLSNNGLDMFGEMKAAALFDRAVYGQDCLTNEEIFHMATLGGAKALNMQDQIGSIAVGKRADLVALDSFHPLGYGRYQRILSDVVFYMSRGNVSAAMVNGRLVYRSGTFLLRDGSAVRRQAAAYFRSSPRYRGLLAMEEEGEPLAGADNQA